MGRWIERAQRVLGGEPVRREEARAMLEASDSDDLLEGAWHLRFHFHGRKVRLHVLLNAKSGLCPEDCSFCSQSAFAKTPIENYRMMSRQEMVAAARKAGESGAWRF